MAGSHAQRALGKLHHLLEASELADDGRLLQRFVRDRDQEAFAQLVARHGPLVLGVCRRVLHDRHEAEDVFQAAFLVLARKAAGIRKPESLSCFLHGVAYRLALKARLESQRRHKRESHVVPPEPSEEPDLSWREVRTLIDEELLRLPERLRLPLVLCYLEGETQDEAARRLGWPRGTLKRRLECGRDRLRVRLTRRGVTLGAGLFVGALTAPAAPAALRSATVRAALAFRGGELATPSALLAHAALQSPSVFTLRMLGASVLALGCVAAVAGLAVRQGGPPPQAKADTGRPAEKKRARVDRYGDALPEGAKLRLGTVRLRNGQTPCDAVFTPDGKTAIVGDSGGDIIFWDVATGHEVRRLPRVQGTIYTLAITPDGKKLAAGSEQTVYLWEVAGGKLLSQAKVTNGTVYDLVLTPDGKTLALADATPTITVWDAVNNRKLHELRGHTGNVAGITLSPDGKTLASGSADTTILLWDATCGARPEGVRDNGQLQALWADLKGTDARRAYQAMWQLALSPRQALPFLAKRLPPVLALDAGQQQQFNHLLAELDSEQFTLRRRAESELEKMGPRVEPALHDALNRKLSLEVRRRIEKMLEKLAGGQSRTGRALEAIEHMNTPEARQLLDALAKGEPKAWLTRQARNSRERMEREAH